MYIEKYWGSYFGGTDDSLTLLDYFQKDNETIYPLSKIFKDFNVYQQMTERGNFKNTIEQLRYYDADGVHYHEIYMVIDLITDLAVITLECLKNKTVELKLLLESDKENKTIELQPTQPEFNCILDVLRDFIVSYAEYDLAELCGEDELQKMTSQCKEILKELENHQISE